MEKPDDDRGESWLRMGMTRAGDDDALFHESCSSIIALFFESQSSFNPAYDGVLPIESVWASVGYRKRVS